MRTRLRWFVIMGGIVLIVAFRRSPGTGTSASPALLLTGAGAPRTGNSTVLSASRCSVSLSPAPGVTKATWRPDRDVFIPKIAAMLGPFARGGRTAPLIGYARPHRNELVSFRSTVRVTKSLVAWSGGAEAAWLGRTPLNATRVSLSETYRVMGMQVSVPHLRVPGFSANGNAVTWSASAPGTWGLYHRVNGCPVFVTHGPVWSASEQADAEIQVGSAFYSIDTMRSVPLRTTGL